jgi:hypothetical protein
VILIFLTLRQGFSPTNSASNASEKILDKMLNSSTGGMKGIVSKGKLEMIPVINPPFELQQEFGLRFNQILEMLQKQAESNYRLGDLFQSLLHRAFAGELSA